MKEGKGRHDSLEKVKTIKGREQKEMMKVNKETTDESIN